MANQLTLGQGISSFGQPSLATDIGAGKGLGQNLSQGRSSAGLLFFGDSTDVSDEPVFAALLGAAFPSYTINYRLWNAVSLYMPTATTAVQVGPLGRQGIQIATQPAVTDNAEIVAPTGDFDLRVRLQPLNGSSSWTTSGSHICFFSSLNGSSKGILFRIDDFANKLFVQWNNNGTNVQIFSTVAPNTIAAITGATDVWLQVTVQVSVGGNNVVKFFYSIDGGITFVQIGTTVTTSGATVNTNSAAVWNVGGVPGGSQLCTAFLITGLELRNGINGQILNTLNLASYYPSVTGNSSVLVGSPTLEIIGATASGQNMGYWVTNFTSAYVRCGPNLVLFDDGFNATNGWEDYVAAAGGVPEWDSVLASIATTDPSAQVQVVIQNPVYPGCISPPPQVQDMRNAKQRAWARKNADGYIDVAAAFYADPRWYGGLLNAADFLHPSTLGYLVKAQAMVSGIQYALNSL